MYKSYKTFYNWLQSYNYRYTLHKVLNILEEDDVQSADVFLTPPEGNANSEEDSADEETGSNVNNIGGSMLRAVVISTSEL